MIGVMPMPPAISRWPPLLLASAKLLTGAETGTSLPSATSRIRLSEPPRPPASRLTAMT